MSADKAYLMSVSQIQLQRANPTAASLITANNPSDIEASMGYILTTVLGQVKVIARLVIRMRDNKRQFLSMKDEVVTFDSANSTSNMASSGYLKSGPSLLQSRLLHMTGS